MELAEYTGKSELIVISTIEGRIADSYYLDNPCVDIEKPYALDDSDRR
jgi:hypothetical protein